MSSELKWYGPEVIKKMAEATEAGLTACAMQVHGQAVSLTPVITSRLVHSLIYKVGKIKSQMGAKAQPEDEFTTEPLENEAIIGTNVFYAPYVELGAAGRPPKSYLRKALDQVKGQLNDIFTKEYNRIMK